MVANDVEKLALWHAIRAANALVNVFTEDTNRLNIVEALALIDLQLALYNLRNYAPASKLNGHEQPDI